MYVIKKKGMILKKGTTCECTCECVHPVQVVLFTPDTQCMLGSSPLQHWMG